MKRFFFLFAFLLMIGSFVKAQSDFVVIANNVNITTDKEYIFQASGKGPFVISFSFYSQNSTATTIKLYQSTDNGRSFHAYPDMPAITIASLTTKASAFRDPWGCQATHFKIVVTLESGKVINGFYLSYKAS